MTNTQRAPLLLIDTDAIVDLTPWQELARTRAWRKFFSNIPDAKPRDNNLRDFIDFAKAEGAFIAYTSRWDAAYRRETWAWLTDNEFPHFDLHMRTHPCQPPAEVRLRHTVAASAKLRHKYPVLIIDNDPQVCTELRAKRVAAVPADRVPETVTALRSLLAYARPLPEDITKRFKPKKKKVSTK